MRNTRQRVSHRRADGSGSQWLSFSDLMSALLLIFILIMFYIMYQYFDMYEINMAEIARQQFDLDQANASLDEQRTKLTEAEAQMVAQQIRLNAAQADLDDAQSILAAQQDELSKAQSLLEEKENEIAAQQEQLDALSIQLGYQQTQIDEQQRVLDDQQHQIEALVGMRTRIITSLSSALREANISAQVDPTNGSIALESDVLFELGKYNLSSRGERFIDRFLPVYLDVLFSEEYRDYVAEIIIEGHTDSLGGYIDNLELSQQRALAVASYVLDDDYYGITADQKRQLRAVATANGRSFSDPVLDANGNEDMDASRRVVFKFRLTDEQMIQQLKNILEKNEE
ncbi:MAG: OmpA family protein [Clostridia bacterium]|nr:OmpA family protein [Clostridia bacterium]